MCKKKLMINAIVTQYNSVRSKIADSTVASQSMHQSAIIYLVSKRHRCTLLKESELNFFK